jgi:hypothetical protein
MEVELIFRLARFNSESATIADITATFTREHLAWRSIRKASGGDRFPNSAAACGEVHAGRSSARGRALSNSPRTI